MPIEGAVLFKLGININIILTFRPGELWYIYSIPSGGFLAVTDFDSFVFIG